jgi:hypothetical protein
VVDGDEEEDDGKIERTNGVLKKYRKSSVRMNLEEGTGDEKSKKVVAVDEDGVGKKTSEGKGRENHRFFQPRSGAVLESVER